jgi:hypothetical protein
VGPAAATIEDVEDVDGGASGGCCRWVWQRPPPKLKNTSMAGPLGVLSVGPAAATTEDVEDVNGEPPGAVAGKSGSGHHQS